MKVGDLAADLYNSYCGLAIILELDSHKKENDQALLHWFRNGRQVWTHVSRFKVLSEVPDESR